MILSHDPIWLCSPDEQLIGRISDLCRELGCADITLVETLDELHDRLQVSDEGGSDAKPLIFYDLSARKEGWKSACTFFTKRFDPGNLPRSGIMLLYSQGTLLEAACCLGTVRACLAVDVHRRALKHSIVIGIEGYSCYPRGLEESGGILGLRLRRYTSLSDVERCILRMLPEGTSNKDMSSRLNLPTGNITHCLKNIFKALCLNGRVQAAVFECRRREI